MKIRLALSLLAVAAVTAAASAARAAVYYVAPDGSDGNPGTLAAPWTLAMAVGASGAEAGDTVYIRGGSYTGAYSVTNSGTASAWITFQAYPGELPILDGGGAGGIAFGSSTAQYVKVIGIVARNYSASGFGNGWTDAACATLSNSNWQFINDIADGNGINGITFYCAQGIVVDESIVVHNGNMNPSWSSGVCLYHLYGDATTNVIERTVSFENIDISSYHSDGSGFILDQQSTGVTFVNNIGFRNGGSCIRSNCEGTLLVNNTCYHDGLDPTDAIGTGPTNPSEIYFTYGLLGAIMVNNLAAASGFDNAQIAINQSGGSNNYTVDGNGPTPFFVDAPSLDFHLNASASVAIDQGTSSNAPATDIGFDPKCLQAQGGQAVSWWNYGVDYAYVMSVGGVGGCFHPAARPVGAAPDIGAYEYGGTPIPGTGGFIGTLATGGATGAGTGGSGGTSDGGLGGGGAGAGGSPPGELQGGGCGCRLEASWPAGWSSVVWLIGLLALAGRRASERASRARRR
jgi:hypothetical protein